MDTLARQAGTLRAGRLNAPLPPIPSRGLQDVPLPHTNGVLTTFTVFDRACSPAIHQVFRIRHINHLQVYRSVFLPGRRRDGHRAELQGRTSVYVALLTHA